MEEILDREISIKKKNKPNNWITVFIINLILVFGILSLGMFVKNAKEGFLLLGLGVIIALLLNTVIAIGLLFSTSSNWKNWAIALIVIFILILGIILYLVFVLNS